MSALIIFSMTLSSLLMLPLMVQPLSLGLIIMLSTLLMCFISAITLSSWYGYILFLIYVGGLLVMFAYVAALSPNVLFGKGTPMLFFSILIIPLALIFYSYPLIDLSSTSYLYIFSELKFLKMYGIEMVSPQMISILIGLAIILLINLIVVVKICYYQHASLRPFND
uniref:NADH dehydrogenase subunit 6 n=1 Tax=Buccinulum pertinax finlayi TaxID=2175166 RepID=A0A345BAD5_9CAEN|nr:NADH dehydrogenase subunit 6 [Buccinulum pertinax finlayi]AXF46411.1 NADH dehydrogenase subunit 6 [Buccinulum pertinax finlayi]